MAVRPARPADVDATSDLHARYLSSGFFPRLGRRFLRTYHASFLRGPCAVAIVAEVGGTSVGFLVGTLDNERHYRWLSRHRAPQLAVAGLGALARDRRLLVEFVRTRAGRYVRSLHRRLRRRRPVTVAASTRSSAPAPASVGAVAVLTHLAVASDARGLGAGRALVEAFVAQARAAGAREIRLISPSNGSSPAFYRALGWRSAGRRPASDGSLVEEFRLAL